MLREDSGEGNPDMSADARSWCDPRLRADEGGRREEFGAASGVLLRLPMIWLAMAHREGGTIEELQVEIVNTVEVGLEKITAKHLQHLLSLRNKIESKNLMDPGVRIHG